MRESLLRGNTLKTQLVLILPKCRMSWLLNLFSSVRLCQQFETVDNQPVSSELRLFAMHFPGTCFIADWLSDSDLVALPLKRLLEASEEARLLLSEISGGTGIQGIEDINVM